jgi:hypothetical protein
VNRFLEHVVAWFEDHEAELASTQIQTTLTYGLLDREKRSVWVDLDSSTRTVRLIVWESGEVALQVGDLLTGDVIAEEHRTITSDSSLRELLESATALAIVERDD